MLNENIKEKSTKGNKFNGLINGNKINIYNYHYH